MENSLLLSVVVCTHDRAELLEDCLLSLVKQTLPQEFYEIIVVDNNSKDNTLEIVSKFTSSNSAFHYVKEEKQGLSFARNKGIGEAKGCYIAFLDDDARAQEEWCTKIVEAFKLSEQSPVAVGGKIYPWYEKNEKPSWFTDEFEIRTWGEKSGLLRGGNARLGFSGSNMAFPKEVLLKYGGFATNFGMKGKKIGVGEETELFTRIYKFEPRFWYDPSIVVFHFAPKRNMTLSYRFARSYQSGRLWATLENRQVFSRKYVWQWVEFFREIWSIASSSINSDEPIKTSLFRLAQKLGFNIGFLASRKIRLE